MGVAFRKIAEPVAWRVEPRVFVFLAFDGAPLAPGLAWSFLSSASFSVLFVAAARLLAFGKSQA
jgi:hypothetical protein